MQIAETERLVIRHLTTDDAAFILRLVNEPGWLRHIGDKGVRSVADAERYILNGPVKMYRDVGFGLYLVTLKEQHEPAGICGLIKRDALQDVDLGFAFAAQYWGNGYAYESALATLAHGKAEFGLQRIVAIVSMDNAASIKLLSKLGFQPERKIRLAPNSEELELYAVNC
jgi:[ribosomal protein S5]-alanine N-acetyltransferase